MLAYAAVLTEVLAADDPADATGFRQRLAQFQTAIQPIQSKIAMLRDRLAGTPITATEPIFGYMCDSLGMRSRYPSFQLSVMNNTEPSASDIAAFENDLKTRQAGWLLPFSMGSAIPQEDCKYSPAKHRTTTCARTRETLKIAALFRTGVDPGH